MILLTLSLWTSLTGFSSHESPNLTHEISPNVAFYNGDALRTTTLGGISYVFHFNQTFWFGTDVQGGKISVDRSNGMNLKAGDKFFAANGAVYWNLPAVLGDYKDGKGFYSDLYTAIGAGNLWIAKKKEPFGLIGGGLLIHFPISYLALRFDLKALFFKLENSQGGDMNFDSVLSIGPSFLF
ncbi:MAG: hypothetical protein J0L93_10720 [Deltaproteobacteria bacterium]|nr:hypothetical protein [Deltaproteobacteria bacterium]